MNSYFYSDPKYCLNMNSDSRKQVLRTSFSEFFCKRVLFSFAVNNTLIFLLVCIAVTHSSNSQAQTPSIDCIKARTTFEHILCGKDDPATQMYLSESMRQKLIKLDHELNDVYRDALENHFDPNLLRKEQRAWIKVRDLCVISKRGCGLFSMYPERIYELRYGLQHPPITAQEKEHTRLLSMGSPPGTNFAFNSNINISRRGPGYGLCEALVRWLNHTTPKGNLDSEPRRTVFRLPGLSVPEWQELVLLEHKELFTKLVESIFRAHPQSPAIQKEIELGLAGAYRLWMVKVKLYDNRQVTFVTYTRNNNSYDQPAHWWALARIATKDMKDIDLENSRNAGALMGILMYFKNQPVFISALFTSAGLGKVYATGAYHGYSCEINNYK